MRHVTKNKNKLKIKRWIETVIRIFSCGRTWISMKKHKKNKIIESISKFPFLIDLLSVNFLLWHENTVKNVRHFSNWNLSYFGEQNEKIERSRKKTDSFCVLHIFKVYTGCMNQSANPQKNCFVPSKKKQETKMDCTLYLYILLAVLLLQTIKSVSLFFVQEIFCFQRTKNMAYYSSLSNQWTSSSLTYYYVMLWYTKNDDAITKGLFKRRSQLVSKYSFVLNW